MSRQSRAPFPREAGRAPAALARSPAISRKRDWYSTALLQYRAKLAMSSHTEGARLHSLWKADGAVPARSACSAPASDMISRALRPSYSHRAPLMECFTAGVSRRTDLIGHPVFGPGGDAGLQPAADGRTLARFRPLAGLFRFEHRRRAGRTSARNAGRSGRPFGPCHLWLRRPPWQEGRRDPARPGLARPIAALFDTFHQART